MDPIQTGRPISEPKRPELVSPRPHPRQPPTTQHRAKRESGAGQVKAGGEPDHTKPQVDLYAFPDDPRYLLAEGSLVNLSCAHGHPSFVMSTSFSNRRWRRSTCGATRTSTKRRSTACSRSWTKKSRACIWMQIGVKLTKLSKDQADYIGVPVEGPYNAEHCRY